MQINNALLPGDYWHGRQGQKVQAVCIHITDGDTVSGAISHWNRPDVDASAHYILDKDGIGYRTVLEENAAWSNGIVNKPDLNNPLIAQWIRFGVNPNLCTIGIEIVGRPGKKIPGPQWNSVIDLTADICRRYGLTPDRTHIIGHYQLDSVSRKNCPGLTSSEWDALIAGVQARVSTSDVSVVSVGQGIRDAMARNGDTPWSDERYVKDDRGDIFSVAAGSNGLYFWHPATDTVYRMPPA